MQKILKKFPDLLQWIVPLTLIVPNVALSICVPNYSVWARLANIVLPFGIYLLLLSWKRKIGIATLCFLPIMVLCAFQIVLLFLYGDSIIAIDMFLNVVTTNVTEASELLSNIPEAVTVVVCLYLPVIIGAITVISKREALLPERLTMGRRVGGIITAAGFILLLLAMFVPGDYEIKKQLFPVNVCYNMQQAYVRTSEINGRKVEEPDFVYHSKWVSTDSIENPVYVLVIGETSRADNWQLDGYEKPTNPNLSAKENLVWFGKTLSESNTTHKSVPMLLSPLNAENYADSVYEVKGIITAFKEAGFHTAWISNQERNGAMIDLLGGEADYVKYMTDGNASKHHYDMKVLSSLTDLLNEHPDKPMFIVLHTYGSHFNYNDRYPADKEVFTPVNYIFSSPSKRAELINAYDNTILYTDLFLSNLMQKLENSGRSSALVYTSDHGEDIYDDARNRFTHASPTPTYWQLHVPMLLWMSPLYASNHPDKLASARKNSSLNVSTGRSVFNTMISLGDIVNDFYHPEEALTTDAYKEPARFYLNDYNEGISLSKSGLRKFDMKKFVETGIDWE